MCPLISFRQIAPISLSLICRQIGDPHPCRQIEAWQHPPPTKIALYAPDRMT